MNFEIINSNKIERFLLKVEKVNVNTLEINFRENKELTSNYELSLLELINKLNKEEKLNPVNLSSKKIEILFEDFDNWGKFIHTAKKIFSRTYGNIDIANYNIEDFKIRVYSDILNPKFYNEDLQRPYDAILDGGNNNNFVIKFFMLHEIGHAIHQSMLNNFNCGEYTKVFNNFDLNINNQFKQNLTLIVRENFADLYATLSLFVLDDKDGKLINKLEKIIDYRSSNKNEGYHTHGGLSLIVEKIKNNELKIDSFKSIEKIISDFTEMEVRTRLKLDLENSLCAGVGEKLGCLDKVFNINSNNDVLILKKLKEEINFNPPPGYLFNEEHFNLGKSVETKTYKKVRDIKSLELILNNVDLMRKDAKINSKELNNKNTI